ncbi:hypothetical protein SNE40_007096 [Patella caerulea]|uniref:Chitin-binding type-4 domain-containing protein n=1 Tax=Patella caerulea TaxID=87958 RepID=A0AAN8JT63_PATCE
MARDVHQLYGHLLITACVLAVVLGHGRLIRPVGRATMWRYGYQTPHDYNDNALYCGGRGHQWGVNNGKCGVCGDPYDQPQPRDHEAGGKYGKGIIVERYKQGQIIKIKVELTANHGGNFEFRICDTNNPKVTATEECLNRNLLANTAGQTKMQVIPGRDFNFELVLSPFLTCTHCVFQWKYEAAQNPGSKKQEHFINCADVAIEPRVVPGIPQPYIPSTQKPYVPPTQKPYVPVTQKPYIPPTQKPYVPPTQKPYVPPTQKPYVPPTQQPYVPSTQAPFIPPFQKPFFPFVPTQRPFTDSPVTLLPPFQILKPKCPMTCPFYCAMGPQLCPSECKKCNLKY